MSVIEKFCCIQHSGIVVVLVFSSVCYAAKLNLTTLFSFSCTNSTNNNRHYINTSNKLCNELYVQWPKYNVCYYTCTTVLKAYCVCVHKQLERCSANITTRYSNVACSSWAVTHLVIDGIVIASRMSSIESQIYKKKRKLWMHFIEITCAVLRAYTLVLGDIDLPWSTLYM